MLMISTSSFAFMELQHMQELANFFERRSLGIPGRDWRCRVWRGVLRTFCDSAAYRAGVIETFPAIDTDSANDSNDRPRQVPPPARLGGE